MALKEVQALLKIYPDSPRALNSLARIYRILYNKLRYSTLLEFFIFFMELFIIHAQWPFFNFRFLDCGCTSSKSLYFLQNVK